jgi:uncharacterized protein
VARAASETATAFEIATPHGPARAHLHTVEEPRGALILGHGAGGGVDAPDLVAARDAALREGFGVALVEQPYRVAGRRSQPKAERLDEAWTAVVEHLRRGDLSGLPVIVGGRSAGARVACRTAEASGAVAVLCLAFPVRPPRRSPDGKSRSRQSELNALSVPTLVVQGDRDQFGRPRAGANRTVVLVSGNHGLKSDLDAVGAAVAAWLDEVV